MIGTVWENDKHIERRKRNRRRTRRNSPVSPDGILMKTVKPKAAYFVYMLECADGTYYTGSTNGVEKRIAAHNAGKSGAKYTSGRRPVTLVYTETCKDKGEALKREAEIKSLRRTQKHSLAHASECHWHI